MPEPERFRLEGFPPPFLGEGDRFYLRISPLPLTYWSIVATGPGSITRVQVEDTLNQVILPQMQPGEFARLAGSTANFEWDCRTSTIVRWQIEPQPVLGGPRLVWVDWADMVSAEVSRDAAEKRAAETLRWTLNDEQRATLDKKGHFFIVGSGGTRYRISTGGYSYNIAWIDETDGSTLARFCAHPSLAAVDLAGERGRTPIEDSVLSQKLMIETDELEFLRIANVTDGWYPPAAWDTSWIGPPPESNCDCGICQPFNNRWLAIRREWLARRVGSVPDA